ncbi:MAG TPA: leucine--tRNA ligase [Flavobacteriaceae bacterium]|nr:leucine--tRNA ligase [Flavobacteriaceae bacterium]
MKQWSMRITAYAQRLLDGLNTIDWPQPLKDSQTNWIGRSVGATVEFRILPPAPSEGGGVEPRYKTSDSKIYGVLLGRAKEMRKNPTPAEDKLWQALRDRKLTNKFRRQHPIADYIVDFVCLEKNLIVEVDGEIHKYQLDKDADRQLLLEQKKGYTVLRFTNEEVLNDIDNVLTNISTTLNSLSSGEGWGEVNNSENIIDVFTTRPDTIFGVSFMTLAPEHELVSEITTAEQKEAVETYITATAKRSERERMSDVKTISGVFTGAYAEHPFTKKPIPIWIGDYVLAGYGTGAVMSVPCGDQRDYDFAKHFGIDIPNIFEGVDISEEAFADKDNTKIANSDFLNGLAYKKATKLAIYELEKLGQGKGKINYRLRDAVFSRQRYWGEPFPVYYKDGLPQMIDAKHLPIRLPEVEKYLPTEDGKPPLGNAEKWHWLEENGEGKIVSKEEFENSSPSGRLGGALELNTMPGWAGSSFYFNRYMDAHNEEEIFSQKAVSYWKEIDLYIGGSEHATGHLLYSRFWQKFLFDKGIVPVDEYAKKLINQGMILGTSAFVYQTWFSYEGADSKYEGLLDFIKSKPIFISKNLLDEIIKKNDFNRKFYEVEKLFINEILQRFNFKELEQVNQGVDLRAINKIHADVSFVNASNELDIEAFKKWRPEYKDAIFIGEEGKIIDGDNDKYICGSEVEKMSKSKYNVVNPDAICEQYGADSLRLYEMFLGPLEQAKPWNTTGITGVHGFLKKLWKLYHSGVDGAFHVTNSPPSEGLGKELKTLHKTIKKVEEDIENFSFNTSVSTFMIAVNELTAQKCHSHEILEPLIILISPYAPHIAEELWSKLGHTESISTAPFPVFEEKYLVESSKTYPISFNGKMRFTMELSLDLSKDEIEAAVMAHEKTQAQLQGRAPKKVIVVPGKIVNIVG